MRPEVVQACVLFFLLLWPARAQSTRRFSCCSPKSTMDQWLIRKPANRAAGKAAPRRSSPVREGKWTATRAAGCSDVPTRTPAGSSFAICPVCERNVPLALLQSVHMDSPQCVPKLGPEETSVRKDSEGRTALTVADDERLKANKVDEQACMSQSGKKWWTQEEQKRRKLEQPLTGSWWESAIKSRSPVLHLDENGAQQPDTPLGLQHRVLSEARIIEKLRPKAVGEVPGLYQFPDFIDEAEESCILRALEEEGKDHWKRSMFNGECISQGWGVRTDLKARTVRQNVPELGERDLPPFLWEIVGRWKEACALGLLQEFTPNEANANCYERGKGMHLTAHFDDRALSGDVLVNLSLRSSCVMTFQNPKTGHTVRVELPQRSLQVVSGKARFDYTHGISNTDLQGPVRISITFRKAQLTAGVGKRPGR